MDIKDIVGLKEPLIRVIDCLDRGISSILSPNIHKRLERAKLEIEREKAHQNDLIALKDAMTQDLINVAKTSRDRLELQNVAEIYNAAMLELQSFDSAKLPANTPSNEWSAHFYDCVKDCSDDEIRLLWSKILVGEICNPGKYYKRTLTYLKQMEKHEAVWFSELCKYTIYDEVVPRFVMDDNVFPFNRYQSLVDCGFINASDGNMRISNDSVLRLKSISINVNLKADSYNLRVLTLTDTGVQICQLVNTPTDEAFTNKLVDVINKSGQATAEIMK